MDKFWVWMEEKGYTIIECINNACKDFIEIDKDSIQASIRNNPMDGYMESLIMELPKQMLIGYMIEYVQETIQAEDIGWMLHEKDVYTSLKKVIKGWGK